MRSGDRSAAARRAVIGLFAVGVLARISWQVVTGFYVHPETWEYDEIARNILAGRGYVLDAFGTEWTSFGLPVYPLLLTFLHAIGGGADSYLAVGIAQAALSATTGSLTFLMGHHVWGLRAGLAAGLLVALSPGLIVYSAKVHELNLEAPVAAALLLAAIGSIKDRSPMGATLLGATSGFAALVRPTLGAFAFFSVVMLAVRRHAPARVLVAGLLLVAGLGISTARNAALTGGLGRPTPGTCVQLWVGHNAAAGTGAYTTDGRPIFEAMSDGLRARLEGRDEFHQGSAFCEEATEFIRSDLPRTAGRVIAKFAQFWWPLADFDGPYPSVSQAAYKLVFAIELILAAVGLAILARHSRVIAFVVVAQMISISASQAAVYVEGRHRLMLEATLAMLAALALASALTKLAPRRPRAATR